LFVGNYVIRGIASLKIRDSEGRLVGDLLEG